jgi:low temperature requirement protein LtrA
VQVPHPEVRHGTEQASVTPLELFFDLVFVFALTQVTAFMADDLTWNGLFRGTLIVMLLWWCWIGWAWIANISSPDQATIKFLMLAAMSAMFLMALCIPEAFDDFPGGLPGPVVVGLCYFSFRALHLILFWIISKDDEGLRRQVIRFAPSMIGGTALLLVASALDGPAQTAMWALALLADYGGTMLAGASGWRLRSASHFAERHGLIVIVALGESIVAIGVGIAGLPISWPVLAAAVLGLGLSAGLWWVYFDVTSLIAERALAEAREADRARLARDAYSYLHLPMIAGVVLVALGVEKVLEYVGDGEHHDLAEALTGLPLYSLYGGVALYLLAHAAFKLRATHILSSHRLVVAAVTLALIPIAAEVPALVALALLSITVVGLVAYETVRFADDRERIRHDGATHPTGEAES